MEHVPYEQRSGTVSTTFYAYRAQDDEDYPFTNVNAASLLGVVCYLHMEVIHGGSCPRKFGVTRILRYRVTVHAHEDDVRELKDQWGSHGELGHVFARFSAFDAGIASRSYLTSVGCTRPGPRWYDHHYVGATYFSLPGNCRTRRFNEKEYCGWEESGGECEIPDGSKHCTWHAEPIGEVPRTMQPPDQMLHARSC